MMGRGSFSNLGASWFDDDDEEADWEPHPLDVSDDDDDDDPDDDDGEDESDDGDDWGEDDDDDDDDEEGDW